MPDWLASLWEAFKASGLAEVFKNPDGSWNWERIGDVLKGAGGALGAVVAGTFAFYKFRAEQRKKADEKKGGATNVTHSGPGPASGRDTRIGGNLVYGADGRQVGEAVAEATDPCSTGWSIGWSGFRPRRPASRRSSMRPARRLPKQLPPRRRRRRPGSRAPPKHWRFWPPARLQKPSLCSKPRPRKRKPRAALAPRRRPPPTVISALSRASPTRSALKAYEEALALDPDDIESLYWAGALLIRCGDLNKAQLRLERVQTLAEAGGQDFYKYAALVTLGDIKVRRGDLDGALSSYRDAVSFIDRLAKSDPSNAEWQRDLSVSYNKVGGLQEARGDRDGALKSYQDSLAIHERLAKSDPSNAEWQRDLIISYKKIADCVPPQERRANLSRALEVAQALASSGRLAPRDAWMVGELARLTAAAPGE